MFLPGFWQNIGDYFICPNFDLKFFKVFPMEPEIGHLPELVLLVSLTSPDSELNLRFPYIMAERPT